MLLDVVWYCAQWMYCKVELCGSGYKNVTRNKGKRETGYGGAIPLMKVCFSLLSLFWKNGSRLMRSPYSLCVCILPYQLLNGWTNLNETWYVISWHLSPSQLRTLLIPTISLCPYVYSTVVARQRHGKKVTATTNTHGTIEELLDASFSRRFVSYEKKVGDEFSPVLLVKIKSNVGCLS
jgi:hypothetical protein